MQGFHWSKSQYKQTIITEVVVIGVRARYTLCHGICHDIVCMMDSISNQILLLIVDYSGVDFPSAKLSLLLEFAPTGRALARAEVNICAKYIGCGGPKSPKWTCVCLSQINVRAK